MTNEQYNAAVAIKNEIAKRQEWITAMGTIAISDENATVATGIAFIDAKVVPGLLPGLKTYASDAITAHVAVLEAQIDELEIQFTNL